MISCNRISDGLVVVVDSRGTSIGHCVDYRTTFARNRNVFLAHNSRVLAGHRRMQSMHCNCLCAVGKQVHFLDMGWLDLRLLDDLEDFPHRQDSPKNRVKCVNEM